MRGYNIKILGRVWEDGYKFADPPGIEIVRDLDRLELYEKPNFNFIAYDDLSIALEGLFLTDLCRIEPIQIISKETGQVVYDGLVRISDINNVFFATGQGSYKEFEVVDNNLNQWFRNRENVKIDVDSTWDLNCERVTPPVQIAVDLYDPLNPGNLDTRNLYKFTDIIRHVIRVITDGEVILVSDFLDTGEGSNWLIGTGDQIASNEAFYIPEVSWKQLAEFMARTYRLYKYHYQEAGQQKIRIEPFEFFFDEANQQTYDGVSNVAFEVNLDRLYSVAEVGDPVEFDQDAFPTFFGFEYNTFEEQSAGIAAVCGSGADLDLKLGDILVNTNKIAEAFNNGATNKEYEEDIFVIHYDPLTNIATKFTRGATTYYNGNFANNLILGRWFDGSNPVSVYPAVNDDANYFSACTSQVIITGNFAPGGPFDLVLFANWFEANDIQYDPDLVLSTTNKTTASIPLPLTPSQPNSLLYTCSKSGSYNVELKWRVGMSLGINAFNEPLLCYGNVRHETSTGSLIQVYTSPGVQVNKGQQFWYNNINWVSPSINIANGERLTFYASTNKQNAFGGGAVEWFISPGSCVRMLPCSQLLVEPQLGLNQQIYEISFDDYPLSEEQFNEIRLNPGKKQILFSYNCDSNRRFAGFIQNLKYDLTTGKTEVKLLSGERPPFDAGTDVQCWVLNECGNAYWRDECTWFDNLAWCDA